MKVKTFFKLYGDPPFCLIYLFNGEPIFVDLQLIRPCIEEYLIANKIYEGELNITGKDKKFKIGNKKFFIVNC